ncbi:MAG: hypothetical protein SXQ77_09635, partial [Halobacteria archaeon]|nr:hypothetical protein [Halobacteria archaeon]
SQDSSTSSPSVPETPYTQWMYPPSAVGTDALRFGFTRPPEVAKLGVNTDLNLIRRITRMGSLSFDGITSIESGVSYSAAAVGNYDASKVANSLKKTGFQKSGTYSGYDIYEGTYRGADFSMGVEDAGETLLVGAGSESQGSTEILKTSVDMHSGKIQPYYKKSSDIATLVSNLGDASRVTGSKVPQGQAKNNEVAKGSGISINKDGMANANFVVVFDTESDTDKQVVRKSVNAENDEITKVLSYADDVSIKKNGRAVVASGTVHAQVLATVFESNNQAIEVENGITKTDTLYIRIEYRNNPFNFDHFEVVFSGDADAKVRMNKLGSQAVIHKSELLTRGGAKKLAFNDGIEKGETVTVKVVGVKGNERYTVKKTEVKIG